MSNKTDNVVVLRRILEETERYCFEMNDFVEGADGTYLWASDLLISLKNQATSKIRPYVELRRSGNEVNFFEYFTEDVDANAEHYRAAGSISTPEGIAEGLEGLEGPIFDVINPEFLVKKYGEFVDKHILPILKVKELEDLERRLLD